MENTMKEITQKMACNGTCRFVRRISYTHKLRLCVCSLQLQMENVCHV